MNSRANQRELVRTTEDVRREFEMRGLSIAAWARLHGYSSQLVYQILAGQKPCLRGQSHRIAVHLGLKQGLIGSVQDIDAQLGPATSAASVAGAPAGGKLMS